MADIRTSEALVEDLNLAVQYAARVGALHDGEVLALLAKSQEQVLRGGDADHGTLIKALNAVTQSISPMTLMDLRYGRNPLIDQNRSRSKTYQLLLSVLAVFVMLHIAYFMEALRGEQEALGIAKKIQEVRQYKKLNELRKLTQAEIPFKGAANSLIQEKLREMREMNTYITNSYGTVLVAAHSQLWPNLYQTSWDLTVSLLGKNPPSPEVGASMAATTKGTISSGGSASSVSTSNEVKQPCQEERDGNVVVPDEFARSPNWIKNVVQDRLNDVCFLWNVVTPSGAASNTTMDSLGFFMGFEGMLKEKISFRVEWLLPFFFGILGSIVFLMRSLENPRRPSTNALQIIARIMLGGVAGIAIGWFSLGAMQTTQSASVLSLPLVLAFLVGYGIDVFFVLLDKLSRALGEQPGRG